MADPPRRPRTGLTAGPGRILTFFYGVLALAATGRSAYQLIAQFHRAPTAYVLSGVAAVIYIVALAGLVTQARVVAFVACSIELAGVLAVGTWSYVQPHEFSDTTVWSGYGSGYGYLPAVLPILALLWLRKSSSAARASR
jgi:hypothetical protein